MKVLSDLNCRWTETVAEAEACYRLRYHVFVEELGASGTLVCHDSRQERDQFDPFARHLMVEDRSRPDGERVIGTARLMDEASARAAGGFYSGTEFDVSSFRGKSVIELGRTCLHRDYRRSPALHLMKALVTEAAAQADILFGSASFAGIDPARHQQALSWLWHNRRRAGQGRPLTSVRPDQWLLPVDQVDRKAAMLQMPPLLKLYLKMGAEVGDGLFVDHSFNCVDVLVLMDPSKMIEQRRRPLPLTA